MDNALDCRMLTRLLSLQLSRQLLRLTMTSFYFSLFLRDFSFFCFVFLVNFNWFLVEKNKIKRFFFWCRHNNNEEKSQMIFEKVFGFCKFPPAPKWGGKRETER